MRQGSDGIDHRGGTLLAAVLARRETLRQPVAVVPPVGRRLRVAPPEQKLAVDPRRQHKGGTVFVLESVQVARDGLEQPAHEAVGRRRVVAPVWRGERAQAQFLAARTRPVGPYGVEKLGQRGGLVLEADFVNRAEGINHVRRERERHYAGMEARATIRRVASALQTAFQAGRIGRMGKHLRRRPAIARVVGDRAAEEPHEVRHEYALDLLERLGTVDGVYSHVRPTLRLRITMDHGLQHAQRRHVVRAVNVGHRIHVAVPAAGAGVVARTFQRDAEPNEVRDRDVVVEHGEHAMSLDHHVANLGQIRLGRLGAVPHVELREHAVAADVGVEEHLRQLVPDRLTVRIAAAQRHGHLRFLVGILVNREMRVQMLVRDDQPPRYKVARLRLGQRAVREVLAVQADQPGVWMSQGEAGETIHIRGYLAHEPEEVQPLEEGAWRFPRATPRALNNPGKPFPLARRPSALRQTLFGRLGELELERMDGVESRERRLKFLAAERIALRAGRKRRRRLVAHALEALGEDRVERRKVMHVVDKRTAAERIALAVPFALPGKRLVRHQPLLLVEFPAQSVNLACGHDAHHPSTVDAGFEVERRLGEEERTEVLPHRKIGFAADVERFVVGMRRRIGP